MAKKKPKDHRADGMIGTTVPRGVKLLRTIEGHVELRTVAFDPTLETIATNEEATVKLWDTRSGELVDSFEGHQDMITSVAFDPRNVLATGSRDKTVKLWNRQSREIIRTLEGHTAAVNSVAFDPQGQILASAGDDNTVKLWKSQSGRLIRTLKGHTSGLNTVTFDPQGLILASTSNDHTVRLWEVRSGRLLHTLANHLLPTESAAFDIAGQMLASASDDKTVKLWDLRSGRLLRTLEGSVDGLHGLKFSPDGRLLVAKEGTHYGGSARRYLRLWRCDSWDEVARIPVCASAARFQECVAFHSKLPLLAATSDQIKSERPSEIHIWELNYDALLNQKRTIRNRHYINAKVVLLGDTGVGKSGLSLVLNGNPFVATDSTPGRKVWTFQSREVELENHAKQTRETLLWDLAGQPGYRVIHQLHLNEVAVALLVFDARSETDPLTGVRHWERALRLAQQRQGSSSIPMKKFLVSARTDRGTVSVSQERLETLLKEFGFDGYFETSAKEGWQIKELRQAIENAIPWEVLPEVSSSVLFTNIKAFLVQVKQTGKLVALAGQLYDEFTRARPKVLANKPNLRDEFETCVGRLENRDLIRRLSFGGYVLLQPELLDAYASAMVNAAKEEPDGLGSMAEDAALAAQFFVPKEQRVQDNVQEQLLLHATVEELARHDLALRESAADGRYLVFPSQFNRDYEDAPEPKGKALAVTFDGPVQSLYATLAVRLGHSGLFTAGRAEMWRNAAVFSAKAGGKCGLYLHEFAEGRGRLVIFYDDHEGHSPSAETRFHFEEFVLAHAQRRALNGTVELVRFFVCANCGDPVPDSYVNRLRTRGLKAFECPCGSNVSLADPKERLHYESKVAAMDQSADRQRAFEMFVESARGETSTPNFTAWAGDERVTLAVVFTDIVGSTAMGEELRDDGMNEVRRTHFAQSRKLIDQYKGREIKTIGDSFMAAFRSVEKALDYARALRQNPGHIDVKIRAGIHIGPMQVEENDVFGGAVNFAARVVGEIEGAEIMLSGRAKEDLDRSGAKRYTQLNWERQDGKHMKGFTGSFTLWSLKELS